MRKLLIEKESQGPLFGEQVLFQRDMVAFSFSESEFSTSKPLQPTKSRVAVVCEKIRSQTDTRIRVIVTRDGCRGSVCFAAPPSFLESIRGGPPYSLRNQAFWALHKQNYKPVRIAVIDTGVDPSRKVAAIKDFINEGSSTGYGTGKQNFQHGTQSVDLIWRMYEQAEILVARVFESDQADERKEPFLMAKAIDWAIAE
ncbi:hypothetical protein TOPH_07057 [Tolypocladium ophioglossoides CBS 100239]|uniref:Peptidase S8/S53 domain-containing protein n=1 Tax=Tolypocladium ophioglossoides (strain CBS 100239) TaxID=1163406 RepID=A0A0L0N398_TOLOC|nr:hypothetical protein TOPH_07057 [Tolypocladium ophioglossoides CBS 100239]